MNDSGLVDLLSSQDEQDVRMGLAMLGPNPENYTFEIMESFRRMGRIDGSLLASYCMARFPFFSEPLWESSVLPDRKYAVGGDVYRKERVFLEKLKEWMVTLPDDSHEWCLSLLSAQRTLKAEYHDIIYDVMGPDAAKMFDKISANRTSEREAASERQMGFVPTFSCSLNCSFCMSSGRAGQDADEKTVDTFLNWAHDAGCRNVRLYGGEPTCYPEFPRLIEQARKLGLKVYMSSNLIAPQEKVSVLSPDVVEHVTAHIQPLASQEGVIDTFRTNAFMLRDAGIDVILRYNIVNEDWSYLVDMCRELGSGLITFAAPVERGPKESWNREKCIMGVASADRFARFMLKNNIAPILAKPFPLCCVEEALAEPRWDIMTGTCGVQYGDCTFNVLVGPDLRLYLCDTDHEGSVRKLTDCNSWDEMSSVIGPAMKQWIEAPLISDCLQCYYYDRRICQGGCLGGKLG